MYYDRNAPAVQRILHPGRGYLYVHSLELKDLTLPLGLKSQ